MVYLNKNRKWVGEFIKKHREEKGLSQRALGLLFEPPVTTQFISNVERGVTPLPLAHVPVLEKVFSVARQEILILLEKEYSYRLSGSLDDSENPESRTSDKMPPLSILNRDYDFMRNLYDAYRLADPQAKTAFAAVCERILKLPKSN